MRRARPTSSTPLDPETSRRVAEGVAVALNGSPLAPRSRWPLGVVVIRQNERPRTQARGDFAHWLTANGLHASAHECMRRRVGPGEILVWVEIDIEQISGAGFFVFDIEKAMGKRNGK